MIVLLIILAVLILLLLTKVGVDAAYDDSGASLAVKIGPIRIQLLPKAEKPDKPKRPKKAKKEKPKKEEADPTAKKPKRKPDLRFLFNLARIGLHALNRFRVCLRIDVFRIRFIMASEDPYKTAMTYGYIQSAVGLLAPQVRRAFTVRDSRVELGMDFLDAKPEISCRLVLTIRIGRVFYVLFATGCEFVRYYLKYRRQQKKTGVTDAARKADAEPAQKSA